MINAIVQNKQGETAVIDLTVHYHEIYKELQTLGYYGSPKLLPLRDEEDEEYSVKLYSDSDIGNSMILLLNEKDSLYDAYLLDLAVTNAREEIKTDLEQNLLHGQYTTFSEVLDDINQMKIAAAETKLTFFCPLEATIYDDEGDYSPASNYTISDNRDKIEDMLGIEQLPDLGDMAEYVGEQSGIGNKLIYAVWGLEEIRGEVYGKIDCYLTEALNAEETEKLRDAVCGQNSDGFGESFEQRAIKTEDGDLYVSYWNSSGNYFLYTESEMNAHLQGDEVCPAEKDARLKIAGWNALDFDDSDWSSAGICRAPGGEMTNIPHTPIRVVRFVEPVSVNGNVYDFGDNFSGWLRIKVSGNSGDEVVIKYSERIDAPDKINSYSINYYVDLNEAHCDKYICKGEGTEYFEPRFTYHGFRYVEITAPCRILSVEACEVHADFKIIGDFECDNELLNWAHTALRKATLSNYFSFPTDCPHREQQGWTGDGSVSSDQCLYNYNIASDYKKWLNDIKDAQCPSGLLPSVVPTGGFGYGWGNGPAWDSALMLIPYNVYLYTGDSSAIKQMWDPMKRYMSFLDKMADEYIVCFSLGDWLAPEESVRCPVDIIDTAYYYRFACIMTECAKILGENPDFYKSLAENIKAAFRNRFMKDGKMIFDTQTSVACAIYQGLFEENECAEAAEHLAELVRQKDYHIDCGLLGTKYIFDALSDYGYAEIAYKMVSNPTYPSYAYWKSLGLTTLPEAWDINLNKVVSLNHHMFGEIDTWLYKHIAGIKPAKPGFTEVLVEPALLPQLGYVKAHTAGIYVEWDKEIIKISSPVAGKLSVDGKLLAFRAGSVVYDFKEGKFIE